MTIKRYNQAFHEMAGCFMQAHPEGEYVKWEDVEKLAAERDALAAENVALKKERSSMEAIEAAEANIQSLNRQMWQLEKTGLEHKERAEAAEAHLAELAKQEPVGAFHIYDGRVDGTTDYVRDDEWPIDEGKLLVYARAAPPAPVKLPEAIGWKPPSGREVLLKHEVIEVLKSQGVEVQRD